MQLTLLPELPDPPTSGVVYLMTDGYLLKFGWTGDNTPRRRRGELRARIIGFQPGSRADEDALLRHVRPWSVGGEWFAVPAGPDALYWLMLIAQGMGGWKGISAMRALAEIIAANLRRAA
jgi:hypothetical protein